MTKANGKRMTKPGTAFTHPGLILRDEFFGPMDITQLAAAKATGIPQSRLSEILSGRRGITADTAARLGRFFGVDPRNWLNLQTTFDLREYEQSHVRELARVKRVA
jgi:addiction module HigA family antidote